MTKYPNLQELLEHYPCGTGTVCEHAGIEQELLEAVLCDGETFTLTEIVGLARLYECPVGILRHPKVIMLDMGRPRHKRMVQEVDCIYMRLMAMAGDGNLKAKEYLDLNRWRYRKFIRAIHGDKLSYCHFLGVKEVLQNNVNWSAPEPKRRGLESRSQL